jgi:hypothetical protein
VQPLKTLLLTLGIMSAAVRGEDAVVATMREKVRAKILESLPPPPVKDDGEKKPVEATLAPALVMNPIIVGESKLIREVTAAIDRENQAKKDERFTALEGGKIASIGPMQLGGWWSPGEGWTFLRLNKGPTRRQAAVDKARLKELQEFAETGSNQKTVSNLNATKPQ